MADEFVLEYFPQQEDGDDVDDSQPEIMCFEVCPGEVSAEYEDGTLEVEDSTLKVSYSNSLEFFYMSKRDAVELHKFLGTFIAFL